MLVDTQKPVAPELKRLIFNLNSSGATSFWVSARVWGSLLNAKNVYFCSYSYVSFT